MTTSAGRSSLLLFRQIFPSFARSFLDSHSFSTLDTVALGLFMRAMHYYLVESWGRLVQRLRSNLQCSFTWIRLYSPEMAAIAIK
jgi:hypothetical protein